MSKRLIEVLTSHRGSFAQVTPFDLNADNPFIFDLSKSNVELEKVDLNDEGAFNDYIFSTLESNNTEVGLGRYNEDREIYKRSEVFGGNKVRSLHLGIDIWAEAGTAVFAPLDGKVHSFKNNNAHADYGPTIILQHELDGVKFFTLYGHLSITSLGDKSIGMEIKKGEQFAAFGAYNENVHWPPHLHFQIISNMDNKFGDFPGVAAKAEKQIYLELCPDPNMILNANCLSAS
ncbi:MAG: peptidoglycan DD-metalloendopeptidase family protein [Fulvivirga sp.]